MQKPLVELEDLAQLAVGGNDHLVAAGEAQVGQAAKVHAYGAVDAGGDVILEVLPQLCLFGVCFGAAVQQQIDAAVKVGAPFVEFHTGRYANATNEKTIKEELKVLTEMASYADSVGLGVNSGHGLNYNNVAAIAAIPQMNELNIGHSIIARAIFTGLPEAVKTMKEIMEKARNNSQK